MRTKKNEVQIKSKAQTGNDKRNQKPEMRRGEMGQGDTGTDAGKTKQTN